jgi:hypothetical protein
MSTFLGLAIGERSVLAAEVSISRDGREVRRTGEFVFPAEITLDKPDSLGNALAQFLRHSGFSASRAVIGVPARWLMAREREIPPAAPEVAASALRLQAERQFSPELKDLVFDYAGRPDSKQATKVLLTAMPRLRLDAVVNMADAAGLRVLAVTSSTLALAGAAGEATNNGLMLALTSDAAELAVSFQGTPHLLRHVPANALVAGESAGQTPSGSVATLGSELRRIVSMMPQNGVSRQEMFLWDGLGLNADAATALGERVGVQIRRGEAMALLGLGGEAGDGNDLNRFGPAVALALAGGSRGSLAVDFLHSRLVPKKKMHLGRRSAWAAGVSVACVIAGGLLIYDLQKHQTELDGVQRRINAISADVKAAEIVKQRVTLGGGWIDTRPPFLECMREVTLAFRDDEQIWSTKFTMRDNRKGQITGKSSDQKNVLAVIDRLKTNKKFTDVGLQEMRDAGGSSREVLFTVNFIFTGVE